MSFLLVALDSLRDFFEAGGNVLYGILFVTTVMWTLIIERIWFFVIDLPREITTTVAAWESRRERKSWRARRIREAMISRIAARSDQNILIIKALMAVLPLLGLLGTVLGMIEVFDVMAALGTGNARAMAGGVSKATIPTMCGLVAALSGLYFAAWLSGKANETVDRIEGLLRQEN